MTRLIPVWLAAIAVLLGGAEAQAQPRAKYESRAQYEAMVASHAQANLVPEELVHRVIVRESKYQPALLGRGGAIGLMQIKLSTARSLGYTGNAEGLRDPETNLKYGIKYLAGAYRAANGDHNRAVSYYAAGFYQVEKRQRLEHLKEAKNAHPGAPPKPLAPSETAPTTETNAEQPPGN
jgi:soluble lytic murein transglycosylase-like protein